VRDVGDEVLSHAREQLHLREIVQDEEDGRATGVALSSGEVIGGTRAVVAGVTPTQLYGSLLRQGDVPPDVRSAAEGYRYGRAGIQIHIAMDAPPRWKGADADRLARTAIVHVTPGLDGARHSIDIPAGIQAMPTARREFAARPRAVLVDRARVAAARLHLQRR
jgi:hypothetical protein